MEGALENLIELSAEGARRFFRRISQAKGQSGHQSIFCLIARYSSEAAAYDGSLFYITFAWQGHLRFPAAKISPDSVIEP